MPQMLTESLVDVERYQNPIHRICTVTNSVLLAVEFIESGLAVSGVDEWNIFTTFVLVMRHNRR